MINVASLFQDEFTTGEDPVWSSVVPLCGVRDVSQCWPYLYDQAINFSGINDGKMVWKSISWKKWAAIFFRKIFDLVVVCTCKCTCTFCITIYLIDIIQYKATLFIILWQLMQKVNSPPALTADPIRLVEEFPRWLEKVSEKTPGGVILVLDSINRFQVKMDKLHWPCPKLT